MGVANEHLCKSWYWAADAIMNSKADWGIKYELIFSEEVLGEINKLDIAIDYVDEFWETPTSYARYERDTE